MKRIFLFLITNIAVLLVLSTVTSLLGLNQVLTANGLDPGALLVFSAIFGFGGAIISLLISKPMAKWSTGAQVAVGLLTAWIFFYLLGAALLRMPTSFHEGTLWESSSDRR